MTRAELLEALEEVRITLKRDPEAAHGSADDLLLQYIGDEEISDAYSAISKWYA